MLPILNSVQYFYHNVMYSRSIYYVVIVKGSKNWNIFNRIFFNFFEILLILLNYFSGYIMSDEEYYEEDEA